MTVFEYRQKQLEIKIKELENLVQVDNDDELNDLRCEYFATKTYLDIPGDSPEEKLKIYSKMIKEMRDFRNAVEIMLL